MFPVQPITVALLEELLIRARQSPRLRTIHCFHAGDWEHCHQMLNALAVGTYICPHRHASRYQSEGFLLLQGKLAVLIFQADGIFDPGASQILTTATGTVGMTLKPGVWHSLVALEDSVIYEVKGHPAGGYVAERDKEFAPWAAAEGSPEAPAYLQTLEALSASL